MKEIMTKVKTKEIKNNLLYGFALGDKVRYKDVLGFDGEGVIIALSTKDTAEEICVAMKDNKVLRICEGIDNVKDRMNYYGVIYNNKIIKKLLKKNANKIYRYWIDKRKIAKIDEEYV